MVLLQVGLLNVDGYYDCLLQLFDNGVKEGFIKADARDIVVSSPNAEELLTKMEVLVSKSCMFILYYFQIIYSTEFGAFLSISYHLGRWNATNSVRLFHWVCCISLDICHLGSWNATNYKVRLWAFVLGKLTSLSTHHTILIWL